jgi:renal tumor antigen
LNPQLIKSYMWQLMKSLDHMHKKGIFHRDIKPENILIENSTDMGRGLKLADFGSCRGIYSKQPYTEYISTRWYRAPECLLTDGYYGPEMDLWGAGCVMFEITSLYPLFPGSNEVDQINRIHKVLGTPPAEVLQKFKSKGASHISLDFPSQKGIGIPQLIPHASPECVDLIVRLLKYDAGERITAREAMRHPYFKDLREAENSAAAANAAAPVAGKNNTGAPQAGPAQNPGQNASTVLAGKQGQAQSSVAPNAQPANIPKALPSIMGMSSNIGGGITGKGAVGGGGGGDPSQSQSTQKHMQQQPSFLLKASGSLAKGGALANPASSLPPIGGAQGQQPQGTVGMGIGLGLAGSGASISGVTGQTVRQKVGDSGKQASSMSLYKQAQQAQAQSLAGGGGGGGAAAAGGGSSLGASGTIKRRRRSKTSQFLNGPVASAQQSVSNMSQVAGGGGGGGGAGAGSSSYVYQQGAGMRQDQVSKSYGYNASRLAVGGGVGGGGGGGASMATRLHTKKM